MIQASPVPYFTGGTGGGAGVSMHPVSGSLKTVYALPNPSPPGSIVTLFTRLFLETPHFFRLLMQDSEGKKGVVEIDETWIDVRHLCCYVILKMKSETKRYKTRGKA